MRCLIVDYGHGGMVDGEYQTPGGKQYHFTDQQPTLDIYEGVTNRMTAAALMNEAISAGCPVWDCVADKRRTAPVYWTELEQSDVPLSARVRHANKHRLGLLVSCHSNAVGSSIYGGSQPPHGVEVYTSRGDTGADPVADTLAQSFKTNLGELRWRGIQEAGFYILRKTTMPAVLGEVGFFTNINDARFLLDEANHVKIAQAYWLGVRQWLDF